MSGKSDLDRFLSELKRRQVYRVAAIYLAVAFAVLQGLDIVLPALNAPPWVLRACVIAALVGFPVALALAWLFDVTSKGVERTDELPEGAATSLDPGTRAIRLVMGLSIIGAAVAVGGVWLRPARAQGGVVAGADVIAVLPFRATGPDVQSLGEGMVDLLSTNLDQVGAIRTVSPRRVLRVWETRVGDDGIDPSDATAIAREVGAGSVLSGSITQAGSSARLTAELHTANGDELARVTVNGDSDQVLSLVDSLSLLLLRDVWRSREPVPSFDVSQITTSSLDAVRSYLRGEAAYRRSNWDEAIEEFEEAVRHDSTFALAHVRLGSAYGWNEQLGSPATREHVAAALRFADRLPSRDHQLAVATSLWYEGKRAEAVDSLRRHVERFPDEPDGWFLLADVEFHRPDQPFIEPEHFYPPFERVLELDPTLTPALFHPLDLALASADSSRFYAYLEQMERAGGNVPLVELLRLAGELTWPNEGRVVTTAEMTELASLVFERRPGLFPPLTSAAFYSMRGSPNELVDGVLALRDRFEADPQSARALTLAAAPLLAALGRLDETRPWIEEVRAIQPATAAFIEVGAVAAGFARSTDMPLQADGLSAENVAVFRALLTLGVGDAERARQLIEALPDEVGVRESFSGWADLIAGDTASGIARLEAGLGAVEQGPGISSFEALRYRLLDAKARRPSTRDDAVEELLTRRWGDLNYVVLRHLTAAEVAEASGDAAEAARHYRRFLHMLGRADPSAEALAARARSGLARVQD